MICLNRIICPALMAALLLGGLPIAPTIDVANKAGKNRASHGRQSPSTSPNDKEKIKPMIVMIKCRLGDEESFGAGIIFGFRDDRIYIATANHVVRKGADKAQNLQVQFKWLPGEPIEAKLLEHSDSDLDLAVLAVVGRQGMDSESMPFNQLGDANLLKEGDNMYFIGNPRGEHWLANVRPDGFVRKSGNLLLFQSNFIAPGHSGGALLNESWELVGMIKADEPPNGKAVNIHSIVEKLKEWEYPVSLMRQELPDLTICKLDADAGKLTICNQGTRLVPTNMIAIAWNTKGRFEEGKRDWGSLHRLEAGGYIPSSLPPGGEITVMVGELQLYRIIKFMVDPENKIKESNETNNCVNPGLIVVSCTPYTDN